MKHRLFDIPTAWEVTRNTTKEHHHEQCSWRTDNMLCDCAVMEAARWVFNHVGDEDRVRGMLASLYNDADTEGWEIVKPASVDEPESRGPLARLLEAYGVKDAVRGVIL